MCGGALCDLLVAPFSPPPPQAHPIAALCPCRLVLAITNMSPSIPASATTNMSPSIPASATTNMSPRIPAIATTNMSPSIPVRAHVGDLFTWPQLFNIAAQSAAAGAPATLCPAAPVAPPCSELQDDAGDQFPVVLGERCPHTAHWRHLRAKRKYTYYSCTHCGAKWRQLRPKAISQLQEQNGARQPQDATPAKPQDATPAAVHVPVEVGQAVRALGGQPFHGGPSAPATEPRQQGTPQPRDLRRGI